MAGKPCVYYSSSVYRKYEDYEIYTDNNGNEKERVVTNEELMSSNTNKIPFDIDDGTGKIKVNLEGASLETQTVLNQFEPGESSGSVLSLGYFSFDIGGYDYGESSTLGYRYVEKIIPVNRNLLVVGEAKDSSGELTIEKPSDKDYKYLVSLKSEENYIKGAKTSINIMHILSIITGIGGVALAILQFVLGKK